MVLWQLGLDFITWLIPFLLFFDYRKKLKGTKHQFSKWLGVHLGLVTVGFIVFFVLDMFMYDSLKDSNMYHMLNTFYSLFTIVFLVLLTIKMFKYRAILREKYISN